MEPGHCSFCLRRSDEVTRLLGGETGARICDECVASCVSILTDPSVPFPGFDNDSDEQLLSRLSQARDQVEAASSGLQRLIELLRERRVSWTRIGSSLGVSRQAAWERFG
jgi:ATP-dependent Clp protease ATP-binding subunit ClpX